MDENDLEFIAHKKRDGYKLLPEEIDEVPISSGFVKEIDFTFYQNIKRIVDTFDIPHNLIINLTQTPLSYCLVNYIQWPKEDLNK